MPGLESLGTIGAVIVASPFLITLIATFALIYLVRRILRVWRPKFESHRWFKTFLPVGTVVVSMGIYFGLSFIPVFAMHWGIALLMGLIVGVFLLAGYGYARNWMREKMKALNAKKD